MKKNKIRKNRSLPYSGSNSGSRPMCWSWSGGYRSWSTSNHFYCSWSGFNANAGFLFSSKSESKSGA